MPASTVYFRRKKVRPRPPPPRKQLYCTEADLSPCRASNPLSFFPYARKYSIFQEKEGSAPRPHLQESHFIAQKRICRPVERQIRFPFSLMPASTVYFRRKKVPPPDPHLQESRFIAQKRICRPVERQIRFCFSFISSYTRNRSTARRRRAYIPARSSSRRRLRSSCNPAGTLPA